MGNRWLVRSLVGLGLTCWAVLALTASRLTPWLAPPDTPADEIAKRWSNVLALRGEPARREGDVALLAALKLLRATPKRNCCKKVTSTDAHDLSEQEASALDHLLRWHRSAGIVVRAECITMGAPEAPREDVAVPILRLGTLALGVAQSAEDTELAIATWHLAEELRLEGTHVGLAVAYTLRTRVIRWFVDTKQRLPPEVDPKDARPEELYRALAWNAACDDELFGRDVRPVHLRMHPEHRGDGEWAWPPFVLVSNQRERQLHRDFYGKLLEQPFRKPSALKQHHDALREELPPTVYPPLFSGRALEAVAKKTAELEQIRQKLQAGND